MIIKQLDVEEGFLDGLSLGFEKGLNVLIGPRGVGKTSVIELLRFALGVHGYTEGSARPARAHARSVLEGGKVTVTAEDLDGVITFVRSADEDAPRVTPPRSPLGPVILSQNEIEQIGLEPSSRMRLIDSFWREGVGPSEAEEASSAMVASLTAEIQSVARKFRATEEKLAELAAVDEALEEARERQAELSETLDAAEPDRKALEDLSERTASLEVRRDALQTLEADTETWVKELRSVASGVPGVQWPTAAGPSDDVDELHARLKAASETVEEVGPRVQVVIQEIRQLRQATQERLLEAQDQARTIRRRVEEISEGAGKVSEEVARLQRSLAQRNALREEIEQLSSRIVSLREQRAEQLVELKEAREERFASRAAVANRINDSLRPAIRTDVDQEAGLDPYVQAIAGVLQGSGLHYNTLAPQIAEAMSPREFAEHVEVGNVEGLAALVGISEQRAARVIGAAADEPRLGDLLTTRVDDYVEITLLHESVHKSTEELSTGQRCTAILPILLLHDERVLILDQPEDHLDNAYVVDTLVKSVRERSVDSQSIVATHNANVPVLGDAKQVIVLDSDGKRGFKKLAAPLGDPDVVAEISQVMEGGADAFRRRAEFYSRNLGW